MMKRMLGRCLLAERALLEIDSMGNAVAHAAVFKKLRRVSLELSFVVLCAPNI
jgi:hypothetical protein